MVEELSQPVEEVNNTYLLTFLEVDGERNISIEASNILEALEKFAQNYKDIGFDWEGLSLNIQLIESL